MTFRACLLAVASGALLAVTFPRFNLHPLAWIAVIPLLLSLKDQTVKNGFVLGGITGMVFFTGTVYWVTNSVYYYGNVPLIPASLITLLLCAYLALYPALFGAAAVRVRQLHPSLLLIAAPSVWTSLELARTYVFSGFPWALLGYSQYSVLPAIQIADIAGVYGVSFLIVLVNTATAELIMDRKKIAGFIAAALIVLLVIGYGVRRLHSPENARGFVVSVVQGNIDQNKKWDAAYRTETFGVYKRLTQEALKQKPDLVVWPETSTPFYFKGSDPTDTRLTEDLIQFVRRIQVPLLFGSPTYEFKQRNQVVLRNSAFLLSGEGAISSRYDKFHLVPFGEYVPLKSVLFFVQKMVQAVGDFASGSEFTIMPVRDPASGARKTSVSTVICYEIIFPDLVRKFVDRGAEIVTTITNDAWFGKTAAPYQHFSMAVLRAVENRVPVARAANTGISGFIDAQGRILSASEIFTETSLTETIRPGQTKTFYTKFGDVFSYACLLFGLVALVPGKKPQ